MRLYSSRGKFERLLFLNESIPATSLNCLLRVHSSFAANKYPILELPEVHQTWQRLFIVFDTMMIPVSRMNTVFVIGRVHILAFHTFPVQGCAGGLFAARSG